MEFVHPEILWGLGALAIPIVVHLLHFRRFKRVRFSQVAFLKDVQRETRATQQIQHWWILLLRLLAFTALILAFAQPTWFDADKTTAVSTAGHAVSIYVDNSLSMEGSGEEGQLLQSARSKAVLVAEQYEPTDQFQVLTNEFSGRDQAFMTRDQAVERIERIRPTHHTQPLGSVLERIENQLEKAQNRRASAYVFSDLQTSTHYLSADATPPDSSIQWFFVPELAGSTPNIWVDSVWFDKPVRIEGRQAALRVRMQHNSRTSVNRIPMNLRINGERVAIGTFNLVPGIPTDTVLRYTHGAAGIQLATVEIDDAPIRFDDQWHFGYNVLNQIDILVLTSGDADAVNSALRRAYKTAGGLYRVTFQTSWSPGEFAGYQAVIVNDYTQSGSGFINALQTYVEEGGTAVYIPKKNNQNAALLKGFGITDASSWIEQSDRVSDLQLEHPFFSDMFAQTPNRIDLPAVECIIDRTAAPGEEVLATTETGRVFLSRIPKGRGQSFILNAGAASESTNLIRHSFWVPVMLRIAERSSSHAIQQAELGATEVWAVGAPLRRENNWSMEGPQRWGVDSVEELTSWLPEVREIGQLAQVTLSGVPFETGHYKLKNGATAIAAIGLNQDRAESNHLAWDIATFENMWNGLSWPTMRVLAGTISTLPQIIQRVEQGVPLWKALLIIVVAALAAETLFLRLWKPSSKA
ncbi:MAG TPA: hypothetical protein DD635_02690 [Flavobacteriales bacterium]|nr:hypothetical protein [Flavobacteriales bacterium]